MEGTPVEPWKILEDGAKIEVPAEELKGFCLAPPSMELPNKLGVVVVALANKPFIGFPENKLVYGLGCEIRLMTGFASVVVASVTGFFLNGLILLDSSTFDVGYFIENKEAPGGKILLNRGGTVAV